MVTALERSGDATVKTEYGNDASDRHEAAIQTIARQVLRHTRITFNEMKVASKEENESLLRGLSELQRNPKNLNQWQGFIEWSEKAIKSSITLRREFENELEQCVNAGILSNHWKNHWIKEKFENSSIKYEQRESWVRQELPAFKKKWGKAAEERELLAKNPGFASLVLSDAKFAPIGHRDQFLNLHIDVSTNLLAEGRAYLLSVNKMQGGLFAEARGKLEGAAGKQILSQHKVGMWLERIFKSKAHPKKIAEFVRGSGPKSLEGLMQNWTDVRERFDLLTQKANERGEDVAPRGFKIISLTQFLSMHYGQRLSYVKQGLDRLNDAKNVANEQPIFLKIRHAMDMKDWSEASALIAEAKLMHLKETDRPRLTSMEKHVARFRGKGGASESLKYEEAQERLGFLVQQMEQSHSEMVPLVKRLLKSTNPNRGIHQLRWITYNNIWCRTHGPPYLNDEIARKGLTEESMKNTKNRAEQGLDIGRNDSLGPTTGGSAYVRKEETSKHKATYLHVSTEDGESMNTLAKKMENEQHSSWLYWTTLLPGHKGHPKPEGWMREFMQILTEMRSLTRVPPPVTLHKNEAAAEMSLGTAA